MTDDDGDCAELTQGLCYQMSQMSPLAELCKYHHLSPFQSIWEAGQIRGKQVIVIWHPQLGKKSPATWRKANSATPTTMDTTWMCTLPSLFQIFQDHKLTRHDKAILS